MGGEEGSFTGCLEDASKLQINGSIGKVEEEANAVAKQADSLVEVEVLFGDDLAVDPNVAYDLILGWIVEWAMVEVNLLCQVMVFIRGGAEFVE